MADTVTRIAALKQFFNRDAARPCENTELMAFWKACTEEEKQEFAESAASQLGLTLAATA